MRKKQYRWLWCSAVILAAVLFRIPSVSAQAEAAALREQPRLMETKQKTEVSCENFLRKVGNLCFAQAGLTEEKQVALSGIRRILFRFLPQKEVQQQSRLEHRIPVSKPKFLVPPSGRLIVGRYIRANPV